MIAHTRSFFFNAVFFNLLLPVFSSSSPLVSGTDYIYMNSSVYRNGTSFVESLFETFGELHHSEIKWKPLMQIPFP